MKKVCLWVSEQEKVLSSLKSGGEKNKIAGPVRPRPPLAAVVLSSGDHLLIGTLALDTVNLARRHIHSCAAVEL